MHKCSAAPRGGQVPPFTPPLLFWPPSHANSPSAEFVDPVLVARPLSELALARYALQKLYRQVGGRTAVSPPGATAGSWTVQCAGLPPCWRRGWPACLAFCRAGPHPQSCTPAARSGTARWRCRPSAGPMAAPRQTCSSSPARTAARRCCRWGARCVPGREGRCSAQQRSLTAAAAQRQTPGCSCQPLGLPVPPPAQVRVQSWQRLVFARGNHISQQVRRDPPLRRLAAPVPAAVPFDVRGCNA